MSRTVIDLDDEVLDEARTVLGTTTKAATVRAALLEIVNRARRHEFAEAIKAGEFDEIFAEIRAKTGPRNPDGTLKRSTTTDGTAA